jgi:hypothetical protein
MCVCIITIIMAIVIVIIIIIVTIAIVVIVNNFLSTDSVYNKVVRCNLEFLHYCHVCNCLHTNSTSYLMFRCVCHACILDFTFSCSSGLLVTAVKPKSRANINSGLFYIIQKIALTEMACFSKIFYHTSCWDTLVSGVLLPPHKFACLLCTY